MRIVLIAALTTATAIAALGGGSFSHLVPKGFEGEIRVDADLGFQAPLSCEIRKIKPAGRVDKATATRVRICS